jgi:hypothetical protein
MALTMIDPTSSWLEVVELPTITRVTTKKVNGKERTIEEEIFDKSSDRISRLVNKIWLCRYPRCRYLTGIRLWAQICAHLNLELRKCLITFLLFVRCQRLIARNDRELFSFNRGVSHLNNACRIDDVSRGSLSCYEILTNN